MSTSSLVFPDKILDLILAYYFLFAGNTAAALRIRLVNRRFSLSSLPHIFHTISVDNISALIKLVSAPYSPLYHKPFSTHVRCFELAFIPYHYRLVFSSHYNPIDGSLEQSSRNDYLALDPFICENLEVVRFKFKMGTPLRGHPHDTSTMKSFNSKLYQDFSRRQESILSNMSWFFFLSNFSPRRFEWSLPSQVEVSKTMYILGVCSDLSSLLRLWNGQRLSTVDLSGVCLVKQSTPESPWCISFLTKYVRVSGPWIYAAPFIASELGMITLTHACRKLVLKERSRINVPSSVIRTQSIRQPDHGWELLLQDWYFADTQSPKKPLAPPPIESPEELVSVQLTSKALVRQEHRDPTGCAHDDDRVFRKRRGYKQLIFCGRTMLSALILFLLGWVAVRVVSSLIRSAFWAYWSLFMFPFRLLLHVGKGLQYYTVTKGVNWATSVRGELVSTPPVIQIHSHPMTRTVPPQPMNTIPSRLQLSQSIKYASQICSGAHQSKAL